MRARRALAAVLALSLAAPAQAHDPAVAFGTDNGLFAADGECDDPRFEGPGSSNLGMVTELGSDATDCRAAWEAGEIALRPGDALMADGIFRGVYDGVDFGDNLGRYARDGECDDPRFTGNGVSSGRYPDHAYQDAADCRAAYAEGRVWLAGHGVDPLSARYDGVDFGDNLGEFPRDGICDDPRFAGPGMGQTALMESDIGHDADDCLRAWMDGDLSLVEETEERPR